MKYLFLLLAFFIVIVSCNDKPVQKQQVITRDISIQPQNAFTNLQLDSVSVAGFLAGNNINESKGNELTGFYNARNYQYAWFTEDGLSEAGQAFWNLHQGQRVLAKDSTQGDKQLHLAMQRLLEEEVPQLTPDTLRQIELNLTLHFFEYVKTSFGGTIDPSEMQWHIPIRKLDAVALLDSFLTGKGKDFQPLNKAYHLLKAEVKRYSDIVKSGGWDSIPFKPESFKKGQGSDAVAALKTRLRANGDFNSDDTSRLFTAELMEAVKLAQRGYGLKDDGIVTRDLIDRLNVPVEERVQQLLINLERMRWLPAWPENRLVANIPEYRLHVIENNKEVFGMNIVVGKAANRTVIFSDELQYVVFSPYWNVPVSIVKNEIVPAMNRNRNYISRNNMEITSYSNGLPVVRQKPGGGNALGRVKFIFPNRFNIYFHDTPAKTLFSRQARAFSHGCVRLQEPFTLAKYLLRNDTLWTDAKIKKAMNSGKEDWVKLSGTVPVYLLYITAWVDEAGKLNFRDDIYGHDKRMADRLFIETNKEPVKS